MAVLATWRPQAGRCEDERLRWLPLPPGDMNIMARERREGTIGGVSERGVTERRGRRGGRTWYKIHVETHVGFLPVLMLMH